LSELILEENYNLPQGWNYGKIQDVCSVKGRVGWRGYKKSDLKKSGALVLGATHISNNNKIDLSTPVHISIEKYNESPEIMIEQGDILLAQRGSLGKIALIDYDLGKATINPNTLLLKNIRILDKYLLYVLVSPSLQKKILSGNNSTTIPMISQEFVKNLIIPIPPIDEQKRIVSKIEELFSIVDVIIQNLKKIKIQIEQLKNSILSYSFERNDEIEWEEVTMNDVVQIIDYRGRTPKYSDHGIPHIRSNNVRDGKIIWNKIKFVSEKTYEEYMTRGIPKKGDLLFTTEAPLGEVALVPEDKFSLAQRLVILRPMVHDSKFLLYQIMSPNFHTRLSGKKTGTTVTGISSRNLKPMKILTTILETQKILSDNIETQFSKLIDLSTIAEKLLKIMEQIKKLILKYAFEGKLVPQDPNDEPASVFLEKIKQEKEKALENQKVIKAKSIKTRRMKNAK
jgi:type I restriction enzyme, S subunit